MVVQDLGRDAARVYREWLIPDGEVALEMGIEALIWYYLKECGEGAERQALEKFTNTSSSIGGQFAVVAGASVIAPI